MALDYKFHIVDVFSKTPFGGNQLAVLPEADGLSSVGDAEYRARVQFLRDDVRHAGAIGRELLRCPDFYADVGTRLRRPPDDRDRMCACERRIRERVAGHRLTLREGIGPIAVHVENRDGASHGTMTLSGKLEQPADGTPSLENLAAVLSVSKEDVAQSFCASLGLPFCFVQLVSREAVDRCRMNSALWTRYMSGAASPHVFMFSGSLQNEAELYARMFAPALGIEEDPATGSACAALVAAVVERSTGVNVSIRLRVKQGVSMGRPSDIEASADKIAGALTSVSVGGATTFVASGVLNIPNISDA